MKHTIEIKIPNVSNIEIELDDTSSPKTVNDFLKKLPFASHE